MRSRGGDDRGTGTHVEPRIGHPEAVDRSAGGKRPIAIVGLGDFDRLEFDAERPNRSVQDPKVSREGGIVRRNEQADLRRRRLDLLQKRNALHHQLRKEHGLAGDVAAGMAKTVGEADGDEIAGDRRDDRDGLRHPMRGINAWSACHRDIDLEIDQLLGQSRQPIFLLIHASVREAWLDLDRFAGDVAELGEVRP